MVTGLPKLKRITLQNGQVVDSQMHTILQVVSTMIGVNVLDYVTQGSWSTRVSASGSTHSGAGVVDISGRLGIAKLREFVSAFRRVTAGYGVAWVRTPDQGDWPLHVHALIVTSETAQSAISQYNAYKRGENGLGKKQKDDGPREWVTGSPFALTAPTGAPMVSESGSSGVRDLASVIRTASEPDFIRRILYFILGVLLITVAIIRLTANALPVDLGTIGKALTK